MSDTYPECDCFSVGDHRRAICRGESRHPLNGPGSVNAYRKRWGFEPLTDVSLPSLPVPRKSRGLGDRVRDVTKALGIPHCGSCGKRQALLNKWFPADLPPVEPVNLDHPTRHLTCHLWPVRDFGAWQWNCDQLLSHADLFNGKRIVSIAVSDETDSADAVRDYLRDFTTEFIVVKNDPKIREVATWLPMLSRLQRYQGESDVTFSCHGKCVRHNLKLADAAGSTVFRWTAEMYETCLNWWLVRPILERAAMAGSFRRFMTAHRNAWGPWHYSGTFYWWRNRDVFRRNWEYVPQRFFGTEAWPGWLFKPDEVGVICGDDVGDLYQFDYWTNTIEPLLEQWRANVPA